MSSKAYEQKCKTGMPDRLQCFEGFALLKCVIVNTAVFCCIYRQLFYSIAHQSLFDPFGVELCTKSDEQQQNISLFKNDQDNYSYSRRVIVKYTFFFPLI